MLLPCWGKADLPSQTEGGRKVRFCCGVSQGHDLASCVGRRGLALFPLTCLRLAPFPCPWIAFFSPHLPSGGPTLTCPWMAFTPLGRSGQVVQVLRPWEVPRPTRPGVVFKGRTIRPPSHGLPSSVLTGSLICPSSLSTGSFVCS